MSFKYTNPNPDKNLVGDCVIRAISIANEQDWERTYVELALQGFMMHDMPSSNHVWGTYLHAKGFNRYIIPNTCPNCYTVSEFCKDNPDGEYILATGSHVIAVISGDYYDTWDSGDETPIYYWCKER